MILTIPLDTPNIIIFGQTGSGKSSLINMLGGSSLANASSSVTGSTPDSQSYQIRAPSTISGKPETYNFWDTPGLNEGEYGTAPPREALESLLRLTEERRINLVIYCIRAGRFPDILRVNYDLYWGIICEKRVPIVLVVTGLEQEERPNDWWARNARQLTKWKMRFSGHACVTTMKGRNNIFGKEYDRSRKEVWELVQRHCAATPYSPPRSGGQGIRKKIDAYLGGKTRRGLCIIF